MKRGTHSYQISEGSIYQRSNGKWRAQFYLEGKRLSFTGGSRKEAQRWLQAMRNQIDRGLTLDGAKITFVEFLEEWLIAKMHHVAEQTYSYYCQLVRDYIKPALGDIRLNELNSRQIQRFYNDLVADGIGLRTVQKTHTVIHAALNSARKFGIIPFNPDDATNPPKPKPPAMKFLTQDQVQKFLAIAKESNDRNFALYYLALVTGMRQGELLGLKWENIDLDNGILYVKNNLKRMPNGGGLKLDKPKTKTSIRSIKLGQDTLEILREQLIQTEVEKKAIPHLWQNDGFVFPSTIGTAMDPSNLLKQYKKLLKIANLPIIRFHDLRHTAASLMLNNGVDVLIASQRLGHAQPSITLNVYGHLMPSMQVEAANILDALISG